MDDFACKEYRLSKQIAYSTTKYSIIAYLTDKIKHICLLMNILGFFEYVNVLDLALFAKIRVHILFLAHFCGFADMSYVTVMGPLPPIYRGGGGILVQ